MGIRINKLGLEKVKELMKKAQPTFNKLVLDNMAAELDAQIGKGTSPVQGAGRFADYKSSYKAAIKAGYEGASKRIRPVNLYVTGKLRSSLKLKEAGGKISVSYTDEKAKYHNEGTPNMARRPMLPTRKGETFSRVITKYLVAQAKKSLDALFKKG